MDFLTVLYSILLVLVLGLLISLAYSYFSIAPWMPSRKGDFERIDRLAALSPGQIFYEFGCGDGRVCRYLASKNPQAIIIGIEIYWPLFVWAKIFSFFSRYKNLQIKYGNAFRQNLTKADVIFVFALPKTINHALKDKFQKELKPGAKAISYAFSISDWPGKITADKPKSEDLAIYTYYI